MSVNGPKAGHLFRINKGELNACLDIDGQANKGHLSEKGFPGETGQGPWSRSQVFLQRAVLQAEVEGSDGHLRLWGSPSALSHVSFAK